MKAMLSIVAAVLLALPSAGVAAEWQLSWESDGILPGYVPFHLEGVSPADLTPRPDLSNAFPHFPPEPVYSLAFEYNGTTYGGLVADGSGWGPTPWLIPGASGPDDVGGVFHLDENAGLFSVHVGRFSPLGPELEGTGIRSLAAAEPATLMFVGLGLLGAALYGRRRHGARPRAGTTGSRARTP